MIHLKFTDAHYVNLNPSSKGKPYLRAVKYAISFSSSSYIYVYFNGACVNILMIIF